MGSYSSPSNEKKGSRNFGMENIGQVLENKRGLFRSTLFIKLRLAVLNSQVKLHSANLIIPKLSIYYKVTCKGIVVIWANSDTKSTTSCLFLLVQPYSPPFPQKKLQKARPTVDTQPFFIFRAWGLRG